MNDVYLQVMLLVRSLWMRRWYALALAWIVTLSGWAYVATIPDKYTSSAKIYIDTETLLQPLLSRLSVQPNLDQQIRVMQQTFLSRPNLERAVRMSDIDLEASSQAQFEGMVGQLAGNVRLVPEGVNLFKLIYEDQRPERARKVVQSLLTIFVEQNLSMSRTEIAQARRFIDEQLRDYERQLTEAESRRAKFRQENIGMIPGEENYYFRMQRERGDLARLKSQLDEAEFVRAQLEERLRKTPRLVPITSPDSDTYGPMRRINELQQQLSELEVAGYTDKHPDVISTREALENARQRWAAQQEDMAALTENSDGSGLAANATMPNPIYESLQLRIIEHETSIARLNGKVREQNKMIAELEGLAKQVPEIEAEMTRLDRDYNILKKKYEELLASREQARMTQEVEAKSDKVQFRIIEPPELPNRPSSPDRPLLLLGVLMAGLAAGGGIAFLLAQFQNTFSTANRLREAFDLPVLGTISAVSFETYNRRRRIETACFVVVLVGLFLAYAFVLNFMQAG